MILKIPAPSCLIFVALAVILAVAAGGLCHFTSFFKMIDFEEIKLLKYVDGIKLSSLGNRVKMLAISLN